MNRSGPNPSPGEPADKSTRNVTHDLIDQAHATPNAPALLLADRAMTYRELNELVWQISQHLHDQGVLAGQVIGLTFTEDLALVLTMLAVSRLGATIYSIPRSATPFQRHNMAMRAKVALLVTDSPHRFDAGTLSLLLELPLLTQAKHPIDPSILSESPAAPWLLITGSGTTGQSKLIPVTHAQATARSQIATQLLQTTAADRIAPLSHFDFSHAKYRLLEALHAGASCALNVWGAPNPVRYCQQLKLTVLFATVFHAENLLAQLPPATTNALGNLRVFEVTSSTVTDDLRQRIQHTLCPNLYIRYGINEAGPVTLAVPSEVCALSGTVGKLCAAVKVQVVDESSSPVPDGTVGLIRLQSPGLVHGYHDNTQATQQSFHGKWFMLGDLGKITAAGDLIHYGRADHMMIMNGINIYPAEIEQTLTAHPEVRDAAAVPLKHSIAQQVPICAVALLHGSRATEQELLTYARERLGTHGPQRVLVFDHIPRNHEGKLDRRELNQLIHSRLAKPAPTAQSPMPRPRQLCQQFKLQFSIPKAVDIACLDHWLCSALELDPKAHPMPGVAAATNVQAACHWLWRVLLLTRELLQASRIPVFDPPHILALANIAPNPQQWVTTVTLALIDQLPQAAYTQALNHAFRLCTWATAHPVNGANLKVFFSTIGQQVIPRLSKLLPSGKSTLPVLRVAHQKDIPFIHLGAGVFQLGWGSQARRIDRSTTEQDSAMGSKLSQSKLHTARLLRLAALPAPVHELVTTAEGAHKAALRLGWPVVVKPVDSDRGEGVTVDVGSEETLASAFAHAIKPSRAKQVLVERQVPGVCHRLFIAHGRLLYAVKRGPMSIQCDGQHTIAQLVDKEIQRQQRVPPWKRSEIQPLDALARSTLAAAGFAPTDVPTAATLVPLRRIESTEWGGVDEEVTHCIHPENLRVALAAARLFGLQVAGIDIISTDISQPWHANGAIVNEVNFAPLLGGAEISRGYIPQFLDDYLQGNGRIPVHVFVGGAAAWQTALSHWKRLVAQGQQACLTRANATLHPNGSPWPMPMHSLYQRVRALTVSPHVQAIVLVVQTDELLHTGLPCEQVSQVQLVDTDIQRHSQPALALPHERLQALQHLLMAWAATSP